MKVLLWGLAGGLVAVCLVVIVVDQVVRAAKAYHDKKEFRKFRKLFARTGTGPVLPGRRNAWRRNAHMLLVGETLFTFYDQSLYLRALQRLENRTNGKNGMQRIYVDTRREKATTM